MIPQRGRASVQDRYDLSIAEMDLRDGNTDLEDCDTEESDEDGPCTDSFPVIRNEDDEPDGPAEIYL